MYFKGEEIGYCSYSKLNEVSNESARRFTFVDFKKSKDVTINNSGHSYLNFTIYFKNKLDETLELNKFKIIPQIEAIFDQSGDIEIYGHLIPDWGTGNYNQSIIDIFHYWDIGQPIDWNSSTVSGEFKSTLLSARGMFSGLPNEIKPIQEFIIDGLKFVAFEDFFLDLADQLTGIKGFFGSGYDSLENCLIELSKSGEINRILTLMNYNKMAAVIGKTYLDDIIDLLMKFGFKVVKK